MEKCGLLAVQVQVLFHHMLRRNHSDPDKMKQTWRSILKKLPLLKKLEVLRHNLTLHKAAPEIFQEFLNSQISLQ